MLTLKESFKTVGLQSIELDPIGNLCCIDQFNKHIIGQTESYPSNQRWTILTGLHRISNMWTTLALYATLLRCYKWFEQFMYWSYMPNIGGVKCYQSHFFIFTEDKQTFISYSLKCELSIITKTLALPDFHTVITGYYCQWKWKTPTTDLSLGAAVQSSAHFNHKWQHPDLHRPLF